MRRKLENLAIKTYPYRQPIYQHLTGCCETTRSECIEIEICLDSTTISCAAGIGTAQQYLEKSNA